MYTLRENEILIPKAELDIKTTLECGQTFRFSPICGGFLVVSNGRVAFCYEEKDYSVVSSSDFSYFINFFDLTTDYTEVIAKYTNSCDPFLMEAIDCGSGIKILRQDKIEMIFQFIISANNNIPRIKKIIEKMSVMLGTKIDIDEKTLPTNAIENIKTSYPYGIFAFPTINAIANSTIELLAECGAGYRAPYLIKTAKYLIENPSFVDDIDSLSTGDAIKKLLTLMGVGSKVADCILLFGFHRGDVYPVDTWIEKHYRLCSNDDKSTPLQIRKIMTDRYGADSGIVQQYIFNYVRNVYNKTT